jgi:hypothetical protein
MQKNGNERTKKRFPTWLKRLLVVFGIVILLGGSYVIYLLKFKEYDVADSEVTEITRETFNIELPDGSTIELDEDGNIVESDASGNTGSTEGDGTESSTGTESSSSEEDTSGTSTNSNEGTTSSTGGSSSGSGTSSTGENGSSSGNGSSTGSTGGSSGNEGSTGGSGSSNGGSTTTPPPANVDRVTVASIKGKYEPVMSSLQGQASSRVDALVGRAYSEYQAKIANGESVNYAYFYNKYSSAAAELEGRTDKVFYQIVGVIENELKANNLAESHVQSFITQYEKEKEARRSALLDKAMNR